MIALDLTPLERALAALQRGLVRWQAAPADGELRDACIQRFGFTFDLCWKMLKRRLEIVLPNAADASHLPSALVQRGHQAAAVESRPA